MTSDSSPTPQRRPPITGIVIAAAVIVALAVLAGRFLSSGGDDNETRPQAPQVSRRPSKEAGEPAAPVPPHASAVFPTGSFDEVPPRFVWTRDPAATSYRLEVRNESDAVVYSFETADSTIAFPAELTAQKGILSWRVVPKSAAGDLAPSAPLRFQVGP